MDNSSLHNIIMMKIGRKHTHGFCIKPDYWGGGGQAPFFEILGGAPPWFLLHCACTCLHPYNALYIKDNESLISVSNFYEIPAESDRISVAIHEIQNN